MPVYIYEVYSELCKKTYINSAYSFFQMQHEQNILIYDIYTRQISSPSNQRCVNNHFNYFTFQVTEMTSDITLCNVCGYILESDPKHPKQKCKNT